MLMLLKFSFKSDFFLEQRLENVFFLGIKMNFHLNYYFFLFYLRKEILVDEMYLFFISNVKKNIFWPYLQKLTFSLHLKF